MSVAVRALAVTAATVLVASAPATADPHPGSLQVHDVQGAGHRSPLAGEEVTGVEGVVSAVDPRRAVFWLQSTTPDTNPATSEGVEVAAGGVDVDRLRAGDVVEVSGTVTEYRDSSDTTVNPHLSVTRITGPATVAVLGRGRVPVPVRIGLGGRVPPHRVIKDDVVGDVEQATDFDPTSQGLDFYESLEAMFVRVDDAVAVSPTVTTSGGTRRVTVLANRGVTASTLSVRGALAATSQDPNPERLTLVTGERTDAIPDGIDVGDRLSAACGVLTYRYGAYEIRHTCPTTKRLPGGLTKQVVAPGAPGVLSVATFNVENLSAVSPAGKVTQLARTITTHLASPSIITVEEIQDDDGPTRSGTTTTAARTWRTLIDGVTAVGGPRYDYRQIDPDDGADGGVAGGNIRVGFLFRTDIGLDFVDRPGGTATTPVAVQPDGTLSISPGRIAPRDPAFTDTRKSLAGEFLYHGTRLILVANHLSSQRGDDPLFGRFHPPATPSRVARGQQTAALATFARDLLTHDPQAQLLLAGDFNDTETSPPVQTLTDLGLANLTTALPATERYTYIYQGNGQAIDHILLSPRLAATPRNHAIVHVNTEFADQVSDHDPQLVQLHLAAP